MGKIEDTVLRLADEKLDSLADLIFSISQENVAKLTDTGELLQSGLVEKEKLKKKIEYTAAHAKPIEFGAEPHMPPVEMIRAWAKRRGIAQGKELEKIAWAIAINIKNNGVQAQPYLRPAIAAAISKFKK